MQVFFIVLARDDLELERKSTELDRIGCPYVIICGKPIMHKNTVYRKPIGKYDAVNFGVTLVPPGIDLVVFNDVDTTIYGFDKALDLFQDKTISLVFARVRVESGPQISFYSMLDSLRARIPVAASGELMLIRHEALREITPLKACKAEDSYMLFKILERGGRAAFCTDCEVTTKRTILPEEEESYKRRTVGGIYQALAMTKPPIIVRLFYSLLPFISPVLLVSGKKGYYWTKGILRGYVDFLRGDRSGTWNKTYGQ
jgi:hypothetical protein